MAFIGVARPVDRLGRIVIPREYRKLLDIEDGIDSLEIYINENKEIVLKKYNPACHICGNSLKLITIGDKPICCDCIDKLNKAREENGL